jgi:hypothetical protein
MLLKRTKDWANDKYGIPAYLAIVLTMSVNAQADVLNTIIDQKNIYNKLNSEDIKLWHSLYKKHRYLTRNIFEYILEIFGDSSFLLNNFFIKLIHFNLNSKPSKINRLKKRLKNIQQKFVNILLKLFRGILLKYLDELAQEYINRKTSHKKERIKINSIETIFALKVWLICWLEYQEHFTFLLRKARNGEYLSIEKIVRIDRLAIEEKRIRNHISTAPAVASKKIHNCIGDSPSTNINIKKIKCNIAGLVAAIFENYGQSLTHSKIRDLFDSLAKDLDLIPIDPDLPEGDDAFRKAIQRHKDLWLPTIKNALNFHS